MGRRLVIGWQERGGAAALKVCYRGEAVGEVRAQLQALWLLRAGRSVWETAAAKWRPSPGERDYSRNNSGVYGSLVAKRFGGGDAAGLPGDDHGAEQRGAVGRPCQRRHLTPWHDQL